MSTSDLPPTTDAIVEDAKQQEQLLIALGRAISDMEEMVLFLAEVHLRFPGARLLNENMESETIFTFGDVARVYEKEVKALRKLLPQ